MPKDPCLSCGSELIESIDADPNGDMGCKCARCVAEEEHDYDAEPCAVYDRRGERIDGDPAAIISELSYRRQRVLRSSQREATEFVRRMPKKMPVPEVEVTSKGRVRLVWQLKGTVMGIDGRCCLLFEFDGHDHVKWVYNSDILIDNPRHGTEYCGCLPFLYGLIFAIRLDLKTKKPIPF